MNNGFGIPAHGEQAHRPHRPPAKYLVIIDGDGSSMARLFLETREQVGEFDASAEEVAQMTSGLVPAHGAEGAEWDGPLASHSEVERGAARVYTLDI